MREPDYLELQLSTGGNLSNSRGISQSEHDQSPPSRDGDGLFNIHFRLQVEGVEHLERVLGAIRLLPVVQRVQRR